MRGSILTSLHLALVALALASCASTPPTARGHLVMAPEVETFQPCGAPEPLWIDADPAFRKTLRTRYEALVRKPYESTFAIVTGAVGPQLDCGFCQSYAGSFRIDRVVALRRVTDDDCR